MALQILFGLCVGLCAVTAIALTTLARRLVLTPQARMPDLTFDWISSLSARRYEPMLRLTDDADFRFLRVQPGYTREMEKRLREHRYRMFLAYLDNLRSDFDGLANALKWILANADGDRANLASALLEAQAAFRWGFLMAKARAYAWRRGVCQVDVRHLVALFETTLGELRSLAPAAGASQV